MIGAVVGTQPFVARSLGTGRSRRPNYLRRFATEQTVTINTAAAGGNATLLSSEFPVRSGVPHLGRRCWSNKPAMARSANCSLRRSENHRAGRHGDAAARRMMLGRLMELFVR